MTKPSILKRDLQSNKPRPPIPAKQWFRVELTRCVDRRVPLVQLQERPATPFLEGGRAKDGHVGQIQRGSINLDVMREESGEVIHVSVTENGSGQALVGSGMCGFFTFCWRAAGGDRCCPPGSGAWRSGPGPVPRSRICWSSACRPPRLRPACLCCPWKWGNWAKNSRDIIA